MGLSQGVLTVTEHRAINELVKFQNLQMKDIMTSAANVFSLSGNLSIEEARIELGKTRFSRIPIKGVNKDDLKGFVLRVRILEESINGSEMSLNEIMTPMLILPQSTGVASLFQRLLDRREHMAAAIDDEGCFVGIVTLEDVVEHMIGFEIYDEQDSN